MCGWGGRRCEFVSSVHLGPRTRGRSVIYRAEAPSTRAAYSTLATRIVFFFTKEKERIYRARAKPLSTTSPRPHTPPSLVNWQVVDRHRPAKTTQTIQQWLCLGLHFTDPPRPNPSRWRMAPSSTISWGKSIHGILQQKTFFLITIKHKYASFSCCIPTKVTIFLPRKCRSSFARSLTADAALVLARWKTRLQLWTWNWGELTSLAYEASLSHNNNVWHTTITNNLQQKRLSSSNC